MVQFSFCIVQKRGEKKLQHSRTYYGEAFLEKEDLTETNIRHKIGLEYYTIRETKDEIDTYGIEVVKKEYKNNETNTESSSINYVSNNSQKVIEIINTLKKYKVTPIGLNDVLEDLLKTN